CTVNSRELPTPIEITKAPGQSAARGTCPTGATSSLRRSPMNCSTPVFVFSGKVANTAGTLSVLSTANATLCNSSKRGSVHRGYDSEMAAMMTKQRGPWQQISTREVYRNAWIRVREDQVIRPDGRPGMYSVVEMTPAVGIVALTTDWDVYLVGQYRYPTE